MSRFGEILSNSNWPKGNNLNAAVAPSATDDSSAGYEVGSLWVDTTANKAYVCVDDAVGAAVWTETTGGGATDLPSLTDVDNNLLPVSPTIADDGKLLFYNFSTGLWETDDAVTFGTIVLDCYSGEAGVIAKGTPVYLTGVFADDVHEVKIADADGAGTFPVAGFAAESLSTSSLNPGKIIKYGKLQGIDTSGTSVINANAPDAWTAGDDLYISTDAGKLTNARPTGGATSIQKVAKVLRVDATGGQLLVFNTNRAAGLPNLSNGNIWVGDANGHPVETTNWVFPFIDVSTGTAGQSAALVSIPIGVGAGHYRNFAGISDDTWATVIPLYNNGIAYDGRNITIDLHWMPFGAVGAGDAVEWTVEYYFGRDGINVFTQATTSVVTLIDITGRTDQLQYTDTVGTINGLSGDTQLHIIIRRNSQGATPDTYSGAVELYSITFR